MTKSKKAVASNYRGTCAIKDAEFDILVAGGGPAGVAAAIVAANAGRSVCLLHPRGSDNSQAETDWVSPSGVALLNSLKIRIPTELYDISDGIRIRDWNLEACRAVKGDKLAGWVIDRAAFDKHLLKTASDCGVETLNKFPVDSVVVGEDAVTLEVGASTRRGKILLVANDPTGKLAETTAGEAGSSQAAQGCTTIVNAKPGAQAEMGIDVIFGTGKPLLRGLICTRHDGVSIDLYVDAAPATAAVALSQLTKRLFERGLIASHENLKPTTFVSMTARALHLEHHVGKRALLIGIAGGFRSALANEEIYPGLRSGVCAGEIASVAIGAASVQDALMDFRVRWREVLAEYLQMPNADLPLLLPLIFRNERMCERIAHAILLGEQF